MTPLLQLGYEPSPAVAPSPEGAPPPAPPSAGGGEDPLRATPPAAEDLARLFALRHDRPHAILGLHGAPGGCVIRAWRHDAVRVTVLAEGGERTPMRKIWDVGFFEAAFPRDPDGFRYELLVETADGAAILHHDPYRFKPTVSELDLKLFCDGKHERAQEHLGAHVREMDGVTGVAFAVWAPNALGVSVVGDFNR